MRFQKFMKSKALNGYVDIYNVGYRVPAHEEQVICIHSNNTINKGYNEQWSIRG